MKDLDKNMLPQEKLSQCPHDDFAPTTPKEVLQIFGTLLDYNDIAYRVDDWNIDFELVTDETKSSASFMVFPDLEISALIVGIRLDVPDYLRTKMAAAVCQVNTWVWIGYFDFDVTSGSLVYTIKQGLAGLRISTTFFCSIINIARFEIDKNVIYFRALAEGKVGIRELLEKLKIN